MFDSQRARQWIEWERKLNCCQQFRQQHFFKRNTRLRSLRFFTITCARACAWTMRYGALRSVTDVRPELVERCLVEVSDRTWPRCVDGSVGASGCEQSDRLFPRKLPPGTLCNWSGKNGYRMSTVRFFTEQPWGMRGVWKYTTCEYYAYRVAHRERKTKSNIQYIHRQQNICEKWNICNRGTVRTDNELTVTGTGCECLAAI